MARVARLGVQIDSTGAKQGAAEVNAALLSTASTAQRSAQTRIEAETAVARATTSSSTAFDAQVKAMQAAQREANRLANEERRLAVAQIEAANAARALTGATATSGTATAAVAVQRHAAAVGELRSSLSQTVNTLAGAAAGVGALTTGTTVATGAATGLTGVLASLSGPVGLALITTMQAIPFVLDRMRQSTEQARKEAKAFREEVERLSPAALKAAIDTEEAYQRTLRSQAAISTAARNRRQEAIDASDSRLGVLRGQQGTNQVRDVQAYEEALRKAKNTADESAEALRLLTTSGEKNAEAFRRASSTWVDLTGRGRTLLQALRDQDAAAIAYYRTVDQGVTNERRAADVTAALAKAERDQARATKEAADELERQAKILTGLFDAKTKYRDQLAEFGAREDEQARREIDRNRERRESARAAGEELVRANERTLQLLGKTQEEADALTISWQKTDMATRLNAQGLDILTAKMLAAKWAESAAQIAANARATREWEESLRRVGETAAGLADVVRSVADIAGAFGRLDQNISRAVRGLGGMLSAVSQLQRAGIFRDANGVTQNVGVLGAIRGEAGGGAQLAAITSALGVVGGVVETFRSVASAMKDAQREEAERRNALNRDLAIALQSITRDNERSGFSTFQKARADNEERFAALVAKALASTGARFSGAIAGTFPATAAGLREVQSSALFTAATAGGQAGPLRDFAAALEEIITQAEAAERILQERAEKDLARATDDARVALLRAEGRDAEADAMQRQLELSRQIAAAQEQFAGLDGLTEYIELLKQADAAARAAADAEQARNQARAQAEFSGDLTARRQTLSGDARGAFVTRQSVGAAGALAQAEDLVRAGTITAALFADLKTLIGEEMAQAIADFDAAVEQARQTQQDDLAIRALVAQGKDAEAALLRREIANREELKGVTDEALRTQILYVQGLEAEAAAKAAADAAAQAAADAAERRAQQDLDIARRWADAMRIVDPVQAAMIDRAIVEAERQRELAAAQDDTVRARLRELYALQDQADAMAQLAEEMEKAKRAAEELARFTSDLESEWLRATGRGFDADVRDLQRWRDEQRKAAEAVGLGNDPDTLRKIDDIYNARYRNLIAQQTGGTPTSVEPASGFRGAADTPRVLGEDTTAFRSSRSITESSAATLVDYAASQLAVQRRILAVLERRGGGGATMAPSVDALDRAFGVRVNDRARLVHGTVL